MLELGGFILEVFESFFWLWRNKTARRISVIALLIGLTVVLDLFPSSCDRVYKEERWVGKTEKEMVHELGAPASSAVLNISSGSGLYEYQSGLYAFLPADKNRKVTIKELQWKKPGRTIAVWLREQGLTKSSSTP